MLDNTSTAWLGRGDTCLLTAAQHHGAAHQRTQEFQVCLERNRRSLECNRVRVAFIARKRLKDVPVQSLNTPRGTLVMSTPESTALDLVGYQHRAGGLNQVAIILAELSERLDADNLVDGAGTAPPAGRSVLATSWSGSGRRTRRLRSMRGCRDTRATPRCSCRCTTRRCGSRSRVEAVSQRDRGARAVIPFDYITAWRAEAPWVDDSQQMCTD